MEKKAKLEKFDLLILNKFKRIKKNEFIGNEDNFFELFVGAKIKDPMKYLIDLVQKNPTYMFKNLDEVFEVLNFFGFELFDSPELYELGGTKIFTKAIKKTLSGKYEIDDQGLYNGNMAFSPMGLLDDYLNWKFELLDEDYPWDNLWKTFKRLPKLKLYQTIVVNDNGNIYWEEEYNCKIGWILSEIYSTDPIYNKIKQEIIQTAKKQKLNIFVKDYEIVNFVKEEDAKYFIETSEYKLIK